MMRICMVVVAAASLLFSSVTLPATATELEPPRPHLGENAWLQLDAAPADSSEVPVGMGVLVWPTEDPLRLRVRPVRVGRVGIVLPADADTLWWEVERRIEEADPSLLRPIEHAATPSPSWWRQALALVLLLIVLLLLLRRWMRRTRPASSLVVEPAVAPHLLALRRLEELRRSGWLQEGRFGEWYVEGSHALRQYVGGRYRVAALDWTSHELLERLVAAGYSTEELRVVQPLLNEADEVKFAQSRPSEYQAEAWLEQAQEFVNATAVEVVYSTPEALSAVRQLNEGVLR